VLVVSVTEARNRLSALLERVRAGETILVVDRGVPVARIESAATTEPDALGGRIARLERAGLLRRGSGNPPVELIARRPPRTRASAVEALLDERRHGR
jgi:prevent-host-death family protein